MPELSPQAQEVFWAFNRAASGKPYDWHYLPAIAAALRAATDQVAPEKTIEDINYVHQSYVDGYKDALCEILNLADELKAR